MRTDRLYVQGFQFLGEVERQLRALLRKRTGGDPRFQFLTKETRREFRELEEESEAVAQAQQRIAEGGTKVETILKSILPEWALRQWAAQRSGR